MGVDTHLYLLDHRRYIDEVKPLLDGLMADGDSRLARLAYENAWKILSEASRRREYPWTPFHSTQFEEDFQKGLALLDGLVPDTYYGDRAIIEPGAVIHDPRLVRDYSLRDCVCAVIIEGLCVPWHLEFPPVHVVTWSLGWALYERSKRFEDALCADIYAQSIPVPYDIFQGDGLVDETLVSELATEMARIAPPGSELWRDERYRNLYLLLQLGTDKNFRILASYI